MQSQKFGVKQNPCVCETCHAMINDDLQRFCIMRDIDDNPIFLNFHYFFPCWDFNLFCQKYSNLKFITAGFSFDEKFQTNSNFTRQLKSNLELWID